MTIMKNGITFVLLMLLVFTSCKQTSYKAEITTIDSLLVELDTLDLIHRRIDTTDFATFRKTFTDNISYVQQAYTEGKDTMPKNVAMLMSEYRVLKKPAKGLHKKYTKTAEELKFAKRQLADLRHDLQNNLLDSVFVEEMLIEERQAVKSVSSSLEELKISSDFIEKKREELEPRIDSLIQVIKEK